MSDNDTHITSALSKAPFVVQLKVPFHRNGWLIAHRQRSSRCRLDGFLCRVSQPRLADQSLSIEDCRSTLADERLS